ncbi:MAG: hypothetical protein ACR2RL_25690, partial [Gammaproteobacteria bacterium]
GGGLAGQFQLQLESRRVFRHVGTTLELAQLPSPSSLASREHVLALIRAVSATAEDERKWLEKALEPFADPLRRVAREPFSQSEMELICETLHRFQQSYLLEAYAVQAAKRWPDRPAFQFHRLFAKCQGLSLGLNAKDTRRLGDALEQAEREGDMRTAHRIAEFIDYQSPFRLPDDWQNPDDLPDDDDYDDIDLASEIGVDGIMEMLAELEADPDTRGLLQDAIERAQSSGQRKAKKKSKARRATRGRDQGELF